MKLILTLLPLLLVGVTAQLPAQPDFHDRARALVAQTDNDLRRANSLDTVSSHDRERIDKALHELSEFDKDLARGKYEKDKLNDSIEHLDDVCKNSTLSPADRDRLLDDLRSLRELREHR